MFGLFPKSYELTLIKLTAKKNISLPRYLKEQYVRIVFKIWVFKNDTITWFNAKFRFNDGDFFSPSCCVCAIVALIRAPLLLSMKKIIANAFTCFIPEHLDICIVIKNAEIQATLQLGSLKRSCSYHHIFGKNGWGGWEVWIQTIEGAVNRQRGLKWSVVADLSSMCL